MSNCRAYSDDVTLVEPISNDFTNRRFAIFIWICIDYGPFTIAITYRAFESAFRKLPSIYVFSYFPFGFEGRM